MDAFRALRMLNTDVAQPAPPQIDPLPPQIPAAPDMASMLGLVRTATPAPLSARETNRHLIFEEPKKKAAALAAARAGVPPKTAMQSIGIGYAAFRTIREKAARGIEPQASFMNELETAVAEGALKLIEHIRAAGEGAPDQHGIWKNKWEASRYLLEVGDPDQFKTVDKSLSATVELPPPKQVDLRGMSDEDLEKLVDVLDRAPVIDVTPVPED